jgi:hypothetical protein
MKRFLRVAAFASACLLTGCGGGGGGGGETAAPGTGKVSFGVSDAPVDDASHVVITVDKVTLRRDGAADVVVDRFSIPALHLTNADTFQIDLLDYRNGARLLVIDNLEVPAGTYSQLVLHVLDEDVNYSYVDTVNGRTPIKLPSGDLKLGGLNVNVGGVYTYTLDFDLRRSMTYNPGPDRYILKPRGVRIVDEALAARLGGVVDHGLFNTVAPCSSKVDPTVGNVVYLYQGHGLDRTRLADSFDPTLPGASFPSAALEPFGAANVSQALDGSWHYMFGYLPAGDYTLAFSCAAEGDFADTYDGITLPLPSDQWAEITLAAGQNATCGLPFASGLCAAP